MKPDFSADRSRPPSPAPATLGDVLYAAPGKPLAAEGEWVALVHAVARGGQPALHALYERAHRPVFTLAVRITANRGTAEEVTVDVFHDVWRRAHAYDPANGTVLGWIMNQARSRAIDRVRFDRRLTHAEAARQLREPLGTVKTRIRAALRKLRLAMGSESS